MSEEQNFTPSPQAQELLDGGPTPAQIARRGFVLASLGFLAACASGGASKTVAQGTSGAKSTLPPGLWTSEGNLPPQRWAQPVEARPDPRVPPAVRQATAPSKAVVRAADKPAASASSAIPKSYDGKVIPRSAWTNWCPNPKEMDALGKVRKITVHHTGNPYTFTDTGVAEVKEELQHVLRGEMGGGHTDIAYHYVIDPAGRVWAARDIRYEGRHTRDWKGVDNRSGNIGIMLLGNFEKQSPSSPQMVTLEKFVVSLQKQYKVPRQKLAGGRLSKEVGVFTHQQLSPTACPGDNMQNPWEKKLFPRLVRSV